MAVSIVRLGSRRARGEGVRIGTVRRPPRGVPRSQYARGNWYDVWLPTLAPSAALMRETRILEIASDRARNRADHEALWRAVIAAVDGGAS